MTKKLFISFAIFAVVTAVIYASTYYPAKKALETKPDDTNANNVIKTAAYYSSAAGLIASGLYYYLYKPKETMGMYMYGCGCA